MKSLANSPGEAANKVCEGCTVLPLLRNMPQTLASCFCCHACVHHTNNSDDTPRHKSMKVLVQQLEQGACGCPAVEVLLRRRAHLGEEAVALPRPGSAIVHNQAFTDADPCAGAHQGKLVIVVEPVPNVLDEGAPQTEAPTQILGHGQPFGAFIEVEVKRRAMETAILGLPGNLDPCLPSVLVQDRTPTRRGASTA